MSETAFGKIWRYKEERYSSMIAQTLLLSASFRDFLLQQVGHNATPSKLCNWNIKTEVKLGKSNQIDILIETDSCLIGIENKRWAEFQKRQLERYSDALKKQPVNSVLVFLSPSRYPKPESNIEFCHITYSDIIEWIDKRIDGSLDGVKPLEEFEKNYFKKLREYLEELEVSPLTDQEIDSLLHYGPSVKKLHAILEATRKKDESGKVEYRVGNYMLASEQIEGVDDLVLFYGFRFSNNWYYNDKLLDDSSPECLVYLKYLGADSEFRRKVERLEFGLSRDIQSLNGNVKSYSDGLCCLAIRRSLNDYKDKDVIKIEEWFKLTKKVVKEAVLRIEDCDTTP
jgi:hypothetical protein